MLGVHGDLLAVMAGGGDVTLSARKRGWAVLPFETQPEAKSFRATSNYITNKKHCQDRHYNKKKPKNPVCPLMVDIFFG
ncbi:TPA: hypothetical protein DEA21_04385 [Candidatus Uhrbacteria bacterium]|nr:hypothetical protein [Candidatus Uhrbacteria bacterium]